MSKSVLQFVIVGRNDQPIYEADLSAKPAGTDGKEERPQYLHHFVLHAALDAVEEQEWTSSSMHLGIVDGFNDLQVSAFTTACRTRFLLLHDKFSDELVKAFFKDVYELYLKHWEMTVSATAERVNGNPHADDEQVKASAELDREEQADGNDEKSREKLLFVLNVLMGYPVKLKTKSGEVYEGVFSTALPIETSLTITLEYAKIIEDKNIEGELPVTKPLRTFIIDSSEIIELTAQDVRTGAVDVGPLSAVDDAGGFGTDSAISRGRGGREGRELERWMPDESEAAAFVHLEESVQGGRQWDQFSLNERKFGVRTDYHEELYTTRLDPNKSKISVAEATRLAAEIERGDKSSTNLHVLEERGVLIDDSQIDEEDRYGAVMRDVPSKVVPPPAPPGGHPPSTSSSASSLSNASGSQGAWGRGPASAPIGIMNARQETNKVRMQMVGAAKKSSPYGTPKSPLASPLIGNAQKLEALNLDPGVPRVDEKTRQEFEQFKAQTQQAAAQQAAGKRDSMSLEEMRSFSQAVGTKLQKASDKKPTEGSTEASNDTTPTAATPSSSTKLNPFAKSFNFNVNAKEFKLPTPAGPSQPPPPGASALTPPQGGGHMGGGVRPPMVPAFGGMPPRHMPPTPGNEGGPSGMHDPRRTPRGEYSGGGGDDGSFMRRRDDHNDRRGGGPGGRDDRRLHHDGRPPPPPPDAMHPPPPPPGGKGGHIPQQPMQVPGMVPMMAPMMMMGPGGMPTGQAGFFMMPGGARPGGPVFMPAGGPSYMAGRPMMVPMMGPGGVPMPPAILGVGNYGMGGGNYPPHGNAQGMRQQQQHRGGGGGQSHPPAGNNNHNEDKDME